MDRWHGRLARANRLCKQQVTQAGRSATSNLQPSIFNFQPKGGWLPADLALGPVPNRPCLERFSFVCIAEWMKHLLRLLRPNGAPGCSHGWSEAVLSRAQPVERNLIAISPRQGRRSGCPETVWLPALGSIPLPLRGRVLVGRSYPRVALRLASPALHPWLHSKAPSGAGSQPDLSQPQPAKSPQP